MSVIIKHQETIRFFKFTVVGVIGTVVDFGAFNLLTLTYDTNAVVASVLSFAAAVVSNFFWNRFWTYPDSRSKPVIRQLIQFLVVNLVGLMIRTPIFVILEEPLKNLFEGSGFLILSPETLGHNSALAVAVGIVMLWNFFVNRYWTYNDVTNLLSE